MTRIFDYQMECAVLFWWNFFADYCGSNYGFYVASASVYNVAAIRKFIEKSQL